LIKVCTEAERGNLPAPQSDTIADVVADAFADIVADIIAFATLSSK
jgi:hypothetical protein